MTCVCQLSTADHVVIWSARTWSWDRSGWHRVEDEFEGPLGPEAGQSLCRNLDAFYTMVNGAATRQVRLSPLNCSGVSDDELLLIGMLAAAQQNDWPVAVACLEEFLPQTCIRYAFEPIAAATAILGRAGHLFTPQPQLAFHAAMTAYSAGAPGPVTLASH